MKSGLVGFILGLSFFLLPLDAAEDPSSKADVQQLMKEAKEASSEFYRQTKKLFEMTRDLKAGEENLKDNLKQIDLELRATLDLWVESDEASLRLIELCQKFDDRVGIALGYGLGLPIGGILLGAFINVRGKPKTGLAIAVTLVAVGLTLCFDRVFEDKAVRRLSNQIERRNQHALTRLKLIIEYYKTLSIQEGSTLATDYPWVEAAGKRLLEAEKKLEVSEAE